MTPFGTFLVRNATPDDAMIYYRHLQMHPLPTTFLQNVMIAVMIAAASPLLLTPTVTTR